MTDNPLEWFQSKMEKLESHCKNDDILLEMKSFVLNSEKSALRDIVCKLSLIPLFDFLDISVAQEKEMICVILYELLSQMDGIQLLKAYGTSIEKFLFVESDEAKIVALKLLDKIINNDTINFLFSQQSSLIINAIECLASEGRGIAQNAISAFIKIGSCSSGFKILYSDVLIKKLKEIMARNDISRFRVYEIIVAVSKISPEYLSVAIKNGFMENLVSEVYSSDILVQLNGLEILSNLATCNHGLNYLLECNLVQELVGKLLKIKEEPLSLMLLPGLIEFFGNVCIQQPEHFARDYPQIMNLLFTSLENSDQQLSGVIISTLCKIGSTISGRLVLIQYSEQLKDFLKQMSNSLVTKNSLAINVLNSLCELLKELNGDKSCNEITEKWFEALGPDALSTIISFAKLPFAEFRLPALSLIKIIAKHEWGTKKLYNFAGLFEYLLNRSSEFDKECKETKYEIVFNIVHCSNVNEIIPPENLQILKEFLKDGPFFISSQIEMATEGAD